MVGMGVEMGMGWGWWGLNLDGYGDRNGMYGDRGDRSPDLPITPILTLITPTPILFLPHTNPSSSDHTNPPLLTPPPLPSNSSPFLPHPLSLPMIIAHCETERVKKCKSRSALYHCIIMNNGDGDVGISYGMLRRYVAG